MNNYDKLILDVCGGTGSWSKPYRDAGYHVIVLDPQAFKDTAGGAVCGGEGDVRDPRYHVAGCFGKPVHGILLAPPCTEFSGAGARWWASKAEHSPHLLSDALAVVRACFNLVRVHQPRWWVLENPVGRLRRLIGQPYKHTFNPCDYAGYADDERAQQYTKRTCLWGSFAMPPKDWREPVDGSKMWRMYGGKSAKTKRMRSATPEGFARAFFTANP